MGINLKVPKLTELRPRIVVIGVGGAGGNAINNMIASGITGVEFVSANTDAQALASSSAEHRIQLGVTVTEGLGAGARPEVGQAAAEEAVDEIRSHVAGAHMVFIAAGMGGGTGTGAAAVIARVARESGALTVAIVTKPFAFEGSRRLRMAEAGIAELNGAVDTLIVIPNQNLFRIANEKTTFAEAFLLADQVLHSGIACITDLIIREGLINLDFADVRTVMSGMGTAMMGTGEAAGERRAIQAAELAILNPLLDDISLRGARGLLVSISGNRDLTLYEVDEAASRIRQEVDPEANIIVGATFDDTLGDKLRVSIVASGLVGQPTAAVHPHAHAVRPAPHVQLSRPVAPEQQVPVPAYAAPAYAVPDSEAQASYPVHAGPAEPSWEPAAPAPEPAPQWAPESAAGPDAHYDDGAPGHGQPQDALHADAHAGVEPRDEAHSTYAHDEPSGTHAGETWQGPGDVVIELGPPQRPRHGQSARVQQEAAHAEPLREPRFTPQPPVEIKRPPRRMPEVEDFPSVGQREYLSKRAQPPQPAADPVERKRPGLFARLTGLGGESHRAHPADEAGSRGRASPDLSERERDRSGARRDARDGRSDGDPRGKPALGRP